VHYEELIKEYAPRWPYPIDYGKENEVSCDVLVLGGGIAGCWTAIGAAKKGVKVFLVEKGATETSGAAGAGVDHFHCVPANPASKVSPEDFAQALVDSRGGYRSGISAYITCRESWDCLLELEKMGLKIRDTEDEFKGAEFRDEATKLLFSDRDYVNKFSVKVWGANVKPVLYKECRRLGVKIFDRVMVTSLLSKGGQTGARVIGATGVNVHTGTFYIFKAKATALCMSQPRRTWIFSTELRGLTTNGPLPALSGDGHAMAFKAGAEFAGSEHSSRTGGAAYGYPHYGAGGGPSWEDVSMVDASGKEIPWIDSKGRVLDTFDERNHPKPRAPGQKYVFSRGPRLMTWQGSLHSAYDSHKKVEVPDAVLPIYADLPGTPEMERKVIWSFHLAQEGKCLIPIYWNYMQAGFDPDKDLLQSYEGGSYFGVGPPTWRQSMEGNGLVVDWDLMTNLEGLFAAGTQIFAAGDHAYAAATGRYAGRKVAEYAALADKPEIDRKQVEAEKSRIYAPLHRSGGINWKELNAGVCKIMQDYCSELKNEEMLKIGLKWFDELEAGESNSAFARNPHELLRLLEVFNIMTAGRMILEACRARKASNSYLDFKRLDYPQINPPDWNKWVTVKLDDNGKVKTGELALDYHGDMVKNYEAHCGL
jgi:succinate dehydrogenase/fumarate reductase flavoprotein subunit